ncbi:MAG: YraN family protein [Alphaproteobacteria bacterium]|nr:YraN family protein [Alphaproteobacteria bacterium]
MTPPPGGRGLAGRRAAYKRGRGAEARAALLLRAKGYRIIARDYRCRVGEIDIIARRGRVLVAVEVKARAKLSDAAEAIGPRQRARITRALSDFMARHGDLAQCDIRFDAVLLSPRQWPRHIVDAWRPSGDD